MQFLCNSEREEEEGGMEFGDLRKAIEEVELIDAHAHNIVDLNSNFSFIHAFSEVNGDAVSFSHHSLSFKVPPHFLFSFHLVTLFSSLNYNMSRV